MTPLITRRLGRTQRQVTTFGLGGQASIQWPGQNTDPVGIIEKAYNLGINYMDTSNIYGPSQKHFGEAFARLGLSPAKGGYDPSARQKIYLATKTHIRTARKPEGESFPTDFSEGMADGFGVSTSVDDVRRSLSLMFGDGRGGYPEDAYLDCVQLHNINTMDEVDMLFEGMENPSPDRPWIGSVAALLDLREGTNHTGCNPGNEKLIRHIGISGHWNTAALIYAIQRDKKRIIDTLLVTINPADHLYMPHRYNAITTAAEACMGVIGMKVFADAAYYHKSPHFSNKPDDVWYEIGSPQLPSANLIRYALCVEGITNVITGIGHIDEDPEKCQLEQNIRAAQIKTPLDEKTMRQIEDRIVSAGKQAANSYFQRKAAGLTPPRNVGAEADSSMPRLGRKAVRVSWDTAYAADSPIVSYEVVRNGKLAGNVAHRPQYTMQRFHFTDVFEKDHQGGTAGYIVKAVDARGNKAESPEVYADPDTVANL
ncbi:MAG: aldo/keto reductase [Desulfobacteraceae bacterium]|nr:aldo/keto reductase [Desulfobacteraceae bacterium]